MLGTSTRRFIAGLASVVVATGLLGLTVPSANAATDLGQLFVNPTTGPVTGFLEMSTHAQCPDGSANVKVSVNGTGINTTAANNLLGVTSLGATTPNDQGGITVTAAKSLKDVFQDYGITSPSGNYAINLRCQNSNGGTIFGDFNATINMVPSGTAFEGTFTVVPPTPAGVATTTTLDQPTTPITAGTATTLTATVSPTAAGTVQFKDGATLIPGAVDVVSGVATKSGVILPAGTRSVTAVFTSADTSAFLNSTSDPKSVVVAGVPVITGTAAVGKTLTCSTSAGATQTFAWLVNGVPSATTTKTAVVPAAWYAKSVACKATFTQGTAVDQTSAAKTIALGAKLVATVKPKVLGTARVGKVLSCAHGTWSPAATSYKYQWFRGTTAIRGKVGATYKTVKLDKRKLITCKVTAIKAGYASGLAAATARKIL